MNDQPLEARIDVAGVSAPASEETFGLHAGALGPVETLAQSVSAMAPSTSASLTIPLVFALAGNGTWLVYLLATVCTLLVGACISRFARRSASPGSLYSYAADSLPPALAALAGWGLLLAYLGTGASVAGGALYYVVLLAGQFLHVSAPAIATLALVCVVAAVIAYRDVKLSAELMLWIEVASVALVAIVLGLLALKVGPHLDWPQFRLAGVHLSSLGPALVLSIFSFAGFESATTLGAEARNPLRTIPRAVLQCAVLAGVFFMLCSYCEVLGFRGESTALNESTSPLHLVAAKAGVSALGVGIDIGAMVSMFACVLACITAAARVLLRMAHAGILPTVLQRTSRAHGTPWVAIIFTTLLMFVGTAVLAARGTSGFEIYDLAGSLSVFGFLTAYALVAVAVPFAHRSRGEASAGAGLLSFVTVLVIVSIAVFDLRSSADAVHARIPYVYVGYVAICLAYQFVQGKRRDIPEEVL